VSDWPVNFNCNVNNLAETINAPSLLYAITAITATYPATVTTTTEAAAAAAVTVQTKYVEYLAVFQHTVGISDTLIIQEATVKRLAFGPNHQ